MAVLLADVVETNHERMCLLDSTGNASRGLITGLRPVVPISLVETLSFIDRLVRLLRTLAVDSTVAAQHTLTYWPHYIPSGVPFDLAHPPT